MEDECEREESSMLPTREAEALLLGGVLREIFLRFSMTAAIFCLLDCWGGGITAILSKEEKGEILAWIEVAE